MDEISCCGIDLLPSTPAEVVATQCRSLFIQCHGTEGMLYRTGEHLLVGDSENTDIIQATEYFGVSLSNQWHTFVKGNIFQHYNEAIHDYSGCPFVKPTLTVQVFSSAMILRKVMLLPDPNNLDSPTSFIAFDFMRPAPPLQVDDILVPVYPEDGDMVNVRGDDDNDVWYAHVLSVDPSSKTCQIHFYIEEPTTPGKYKRESLGRSAVETIHWNSIIGIASGQWNGVFWFISDN